MFLSLKLYEIEFPFVGMLSFYNLQMNQSNGNLTQQLYPIESSTSDFYQQQTRQQQEVLFIGSAPITQSSVDPLNPVLGFTENFSQVNYLHRKSKLYNTINFFKVLKYPYKLIYVRDFKSQFLRWWTSFNTDN